MKKKFYSYLIIPFYLIIFSISQSIQAEVKTFSAEVLRTTHNVVKSKDATATGYFYFSYPDKISMIFSSKNDMLLMNQGNYVMVSQGKKNVAKGKVAVLFGALQKVLQSVVCQTSLPKASDLPGIQVKQQGHIIQIIPIMDIKTLRRMPFTSFTLSLDSSTNRLKSLRIHERGENYIQYDLSKCQSNTTLNNTVFTLN